MLGPWRVKLQEVSPLQYTVGSSTFRNELLNAIKRHFISRHHASECDTIHNENLKKDMFCHRGTYWWHEVQNPGHIHQVGLKGIYETWLLRHVNMYRRKIWSNPSRPWWTKNQHECCLSCWTLSGSQILHPYNKRTYAWRIQRPTIPQYSAATNLRACLLGYFLD